jgi:hypothetical protein
VLVASVARSDFLLLVYYRLIIQCANPQSADPTTSCTEQTNHARAVVRSYISSDPLPTLARCQTNLVRAIPKEDQRFQRREVRKDVVVREDVTELAFDLRYKMRQILTQKRVLLATTSTH